MTGSAWSSAWYSYMNHLNLYCGGKNASRSSPRVQAFEKFSAHMLRHTYATMLYDAGVDIKSAQYFLGHASIELTLSIYTHLTPYKVDQAIGSFNAHLGERINSTSPAITQSLRTNNRKNDQLLSPFIKSKKPFTDVRI